VPRCAAPTPPAKDSKPSFGESAKQFAKGFAHGVGAESRQLYNDTKELPSQLAKAGTELAEDLKSGRELRALAPLRAASHAIRNASRKDVERIAHAVVDTAKEWLEKPAYEKGESLGRATTAIASEVAIDVLTEGIGTVATLRKVGKVADAADHVRDTEKVVERAAHTADHVRDASHELWTLGRFKSSAKWEQQLSKRGWSPQQISEAVAHGKHFPAENLVNKGHSARRYVHPETGRSVVVDDVTKEVIHVGGDNFKY
jgi:hypothetical protein